MYLVWTGSSVESLLRWVYTNTQVKEMDKMHWTDLDLGFLKLLKIFDTLYEINN